MKILFPRDKNTVFWRILSSYVTLVLSVTLIIGLISYVNYSRIVNNDKIELNQRQIENVQSILVENVITKAEAVYVNLFLGNYSELELLSIQESENESTLTEISTFHRNLVKIVGMNSEIINSIDIYYKEKRLLISTFYGVKYADEAGDFSNPPGWLSFSYPMDKNSLWIEEETVPSTPFRIEENITKDVSYITNYPNYTNFDNSKIAVCIRVNSQKVLDSINSNLLENGQCSILGVDGNLLFENTNDEITTDYSEIWKKIKSSEKNHFNYDGYHVAFSTIKETGWTILYVVKSSILFKETVDANLFFVFALVIVLLVGTHYSGRLANKTYSPLKKLLLAFPLNQDDSDIHMNEYEMINQALISLKNEVFELEDSLERNKPVLVKNFLISLFDGALVNNEKILHKLDLFDCQMNLPNYRAILLKSSEQIEKLFENSSSFISLSAQLDDNIYGSVINYNNWEEAVSEIKSMNIDCIFGVGSESERVNDIASSYLVAEQLMKFSMFFPERKVLDFESTNKYKLNAQLLPENIFSDYKKALMDKDIEGVVVSFDSFIEFVISTDISFKSAERGLINFFGIFSEYVKTQKLHTDDFNTTILESFNSCENIGDFKDWFIEMSNLVFEMAVEGIRGKNAEIIAKVKKYVAENPGEDLSLDAIAAKVFISPRYFSKVFKDYTGVNFVNYVQEARFSAAKELLKNTNLGVEEIAMKVGFSSSNYFIKKFRKAYGVTPKVYRKNTVLYD